MKGRFLSAKFSCLTWIGVLFILITVLDLRCPDRLRKLPAIIITTFRSVSFCHLSWYIYAHKIVKANLAAIHYLLAEVDKCVLRCYFVYFVQL